jgi:hypothetical protein
MKPSIQTLGHILYSPSQYVIPVFQRNYRWEQPQWEEFWESLVEIRSPGKLGNHFMGFLVFVPGLAEPGQNTRFHLIDGQQRLTTASILLVALRDVAREAMQQDLADEIQHYYLVHPMKKGDHRFRLLPKERDYDSYRALLTQEGAPVGRIAGAVAFFQAKLSELAAESPTHLRAVFDTVCQRFEFMCATLETENAYNIFKSLNSTGIPLGPSDLIRNFVFMHVPPDEQDEFDRDLWRPLENHFARAGGTLDEDAFSRFFRDYLMSSGRYVAPKDTFAAFEARYEATGFMPRDLARALREASAHYDVIAGSVADACEAVTQSLAALNRLESSTTYPLLLALFRKRAEGAVDSVQLAHAADMLTGFILRRFICGESSRGYGQMFVRALADDKGGPLKTLEAYLVERGWPDDQRFRSAFVEFPLYLRGYAREILEMLERARGHKEPASLAAAQIEHIMPQTLSEAWKAALGAEVDRIHADWLHRPGNLTLSGYNPELFNHPFAEKQKWYVDSHFVLTHELHDYKQWTEVEMRKRGEVLADAAAKQWIGPAKPVGVVDPSSRRQMYLDFWTQFMPYVAAHGQQIRPGNPRGDYYHSFGIGRGGFWVDAFLHPPKQYLGVSLGFQDAGHKPYFHLFQAQEAAISAELGLPLTWHELPTKKSCYISTYLHNVDPVDRNCWPEYNQWLLAALEKFHACFAARVKVLNAADFQPSQS